MKRLNLLPGNELQSVIEPLASYICAAEHPRATLASALALLFNEVEETNRAATAQCNAFAGHASVCC